MIIHVEYASYRPIRICSESIVIYLKLLSCYWLDEIEKNRKRRQWMTGNLVLILMCVHRIQVCNVIVSPLTDSVRLM